MFQATNTFYLFILTTLSVLQSLALIRDAEDVWIVDALNSVEIISDIKLWGLAVSAHTGPLGVDGETVGLRHRHRECVIVVNWGIL